ncbi:hypothetical protein [Paenibacillus cineris]|uniref:Uncharacterized protein n=1 Tax=Paenibacillus cineris TaxID=237530 RepID=A0ABQ4LN82_9BACL|nr:hypothetical protein [Paenibacillus cineris]GIO57972.1 hypothetical protein J21TS7_62900 [Paenibacillus cineris]
MSGKVIQNDEQYEKAQEAIIKIALELEDPLLSPEKRAKKQQIYDRTTDLMMRYRRGGLVLEFPYLKEAYEQIGYQWQEREPESAQRVDMVQQADTGSNGTHGKSEPLEEQPEAEAITSASKIMAWLDE